MRVPTGFAVTLQDWRRVQRTSIRSKFLSSFGGHSLACVAWRAGR